MNPDQRLLAIGVYIMSALYLTGCFVASLFVQHGVAWKVALVSAGLSCLAYTAQVSFVEARLWALALVALSQWFGLIAGLCVLFGG